MAEVLKKSSKIKIGIVSLGLIGGSILKGLYKNKDYELFCCSKGSFEEAKKYCTYASDDINIVKDCDIVFVCSPISKTLSMLEKLDKIVKKETIVADVASVKGELSDKKFNFDFILSHPMAGSEKSGFSASCADLFKSAKWLIQKNNPILEKIIADLGAVALKIDMNKHDYMCAQISHMPTILSYLIFENASDNALELASSGFRDMTRLACGDLTLAIDMLKYNEKNILKSLDDLKEKIEKLKSLDENKKEELFKDITKKRTKMYDNNGKNIFTIL